MNETAIGRPEEYGYVGVELYCALCGKDMNTTQWCRIGEIKPVYCNDCKRAVKIAQMQAAGALPDVDK